MLNDYDREKLVIEPTRGEVIFDLILSGAHGLVSDGNICEQIGNSDHKAILCNITVGGKLIRKSNTAPFNFK